MDTLRLKEPKRDGRVLDRPGNIALGFTDPRADQVCLDLDVGRRIPADGAPMLGEVRQSRARVTRSQQPIGVVNTALRW